jgi:hypothetical protein
LVASLISFSAPLFGFSQLNCSVDFKEFFGNASLASSFSGNDESHLFLL